MQERTNTRERPRKPLAAESSKEPGYPMTMEDVDRYLRDREEQGLLTGSARRYRQALTMFYDSLPEDKCVRRGTLEAWLDARLAEGYSPRTVSLFYSVCNGFLNYVGHREYQAPEPPVPNEYAPQPELSREEYLLLLRTAKRTGDQRGYFVVKIIAATGITAQSFGAVTIEALRSGVLEADGQKVIIPDCLCQELLDYARRNAIETGPVMLARTGTVMDRFTVNKAVQRLAAAAKLPQGKGNPRCLRRFYQRTRAAIDREMARLAQRAFEQQMEREQFVYGWDA